MMRRWGGVGKRCLGMGLRKVEGEVEEAVVVVVDVAVPLVLGVVLLPLGRGEVEVLGLRLNMLRIVYVER